MGIYFLYRMHPLTVAELTSPAISDREIRMPIELPDDQWQRLVRFGGFPQPFIRGKKQFYNRWKRTRLSQVFREDMCDIARVQEIRLVEMPAEFIGWQAGRMTSYASLAGRLRVSEDSVRRWLGILENLYYCFSIRPWHNNLARFLRKEPKYYL